MKNENKKSGFTLVEIMIVVVIIGLLAAMAIPAFNKVRETSQNKAITNNLRQIASAADQYFIESGQDSVAYTDVVGTDKYVKSLSTVAGEDYSTQISWPVDEDFTQLIVTKSNGVSVTYEP